MIANHLKHGQQALGLIGLRLVDLVVGRWVDAQPIFHKNLINGDDVKIVLFKKNMRN